jgi:hypothetical protein
MKDAAILDKQAASLQARSGKKYVIYTCVTNGYSEVMPAPQSLRDTFDFILFSDIPCAVDGWSQLSFEPFQTDPRRNAKFCKILPHEVLSAYESSIWVDGNFRVLSALDDLFQTFLKADEVLMLFHHRRRNCIYEEAKECLRWGKDLPDVINDQMLEYKRLGHPEGWGLFMGGFLIRKHNSSICMKVMQDWWQEVDAHSVRDQLSLPVVLRRHDLKILDQPYEMVSTYFEMLPHEKYRSYALRGRNLINLRAWLAPLIYKITTTLNQLRKKSRCG